MFRATAGLQAKYGKTRVFDTPITECGIIVVEKKGDDFIRPVGIEGPPIPAPPEELQHLHFGDAILYFMRP